MGRTALRTFLLLAHRLGVEGDGRLHRRKAEDLHNVVLDDVAHGAGFLVERPAGAHAYIFGDRDLDVVDVVLVPDRLEDPVGEPQGKDVLDRLLAEVVVDAVDLGLIEVPLELGVEILGTPEIRPKGFSTTSLDQPPSSPWFNPASPRFSTMAGKSEGEEER